MSRMSAITRDDVALALAALDESDDRPAALLRICQLVSEGVIEVCAKIAEERCHPKVCHQDAAQIIRALNVVP